jgi:hypothetical protein
MPSATNWTARGITLLILWAPIVLVLTVIQPTSGRPTPLHGVTALVLALILEHMLYGLFCIPVANSAHGRHRVLPRARHGGVHAAALAVGMWSYASWTLDTRGSPVIAGLTILSGLVFLFGARAFRKQSLWGGWFEVHDGMLVLRGTASDYSVPLGQILTVHRRERDGSFWIETPWIERNSLVLTPGARGRYWIEEAEDLLRLLGPAVEVREVKALIGLLRGRHR